MDDIAHDTNARTARRFLGRMGWRSLEILVLVSFAVAQPLFSLFGENATYLAAHGLIGADLVWFALTIVFVPTLVLVGVEALTELVDPRVASYLHTGVVGILLGLLVGPPVNRLLGIDGALSVVVLVALMVGGALLVARFEVVTRLIRYGAFAPALVLTLFLALSPASRLLDDGVAVSELTSTPADAPIVWVTFDQFPLSFLVDERGEIIEDRYPNFARLAEMSTWYPTTSSIAVATTDSVPASLSGIEPTGGLPVASEYPNNLFTLFGDTHEVLADEYVTQLCPDSVCRGAQRASGRDTVWSDTSAVFVRTVLAPDVADRFVPRVDDRWHNFGSEHDSADLVVASEAQNRGDIKVNRAAEDDDRVRFQDFLDGFAADELPTVHYIHLFQPHEPLRFLPTGQRIDPAPSFTVDDDGRWPDNQLMLDQRVQQYVLQAMHADREVGRLLDRLEETELLDDALVVVTSDHGVSTWPGTVNRVYAEDTADDLLPVPLFIKRPGQQTAEVDPRLAQQVDILPTVLDLVGVDDESRPDFDGVSLAGPSDPDRPARLLGPDGMMVLERQPDVLQSPTMAWIASLMAEAENPYAFGPDAALFGQTAAPLVIEDSDLSISLGMTEQYLDVDPAAAFVPANVYGTLAGAERPTRLAVAVNGTIAGLGSSFFNDGWQVTIIVDPSFLSDGDNELQVFEVDAEGLRPIPMD